jgi:hypothetical protein
MKRYGEAFVGIDAAKARNAVAVAEEGRDGEIRYLGEIDNRITRFGVPRHRSRPRNPSQRKRLMISATCTRSPRRSARLLNGSTTSRQHRPHWMWSCHSLMSPIGVAGTGSALWGSSGTGHWP